MIRYNSGSFGFSLLFRINGSAVYKSFLPCLLSSAIFLILYFTNIQSITLFSHPYAIGALIAALTFMLSHRANFSYMRWWEAMQSVHHMHSKLLDAGTAMAAFHLQAAVYDQRKPPAFGQYPELNTLERAARKNNPPTLAELETQLDEQIMAQQEEPSRMEENVSSTSLRSRFRRRRTKSRPRPDSAAAAFSIKESNDSVRSTTPSVVHRSDRYAAPPKSINATLQRLPEQLSYSFSPFAPITRFFQQTKNPTESTPQRTVQQSELTRKGTVEHVVQSVADHEMRAWDKDKPPLFLQEGAHLLSLLSAVAFSTLRNDLEHAASPLIPFTPGAPWPHVDPDAYTADVRRDWTETDHKSLVVLKYICGFTRTPKARTLYNAARPFRVINGVSDAEIELLQAARGPLAKVALVNMWLTEFISREYQGKSMGTVAPPIISRLYQFISDAMLGYNQARKIAYVPFPFPHAQITSLFVFLVTALMPVLMLQYLPNIAFGFTLNLLTVMCFNGLQNVAQELESPFQAVPNDIPLNRFQAEFNESLLQMLVGLASDSYWEVVANEKKPEEEKGGETRSSASETDAPPFTKDSKLAPPRESDEEDQASVEASMASETRIVDSPV